MRKDITLKIEVTTNLDSDDLKTIVNGLRAHNGRHIGEKAFREDLKFAVLAKDDKAKVVGGIRAIAYWNYLHIDLLWVEDEKRKTGLGSRLLAEAERFAKENGFFLSRLETTSFQARKFYEKNGYEVFGKLDDYPKGFQYFFMKKKLVS